MQVHHLLQKTEAARALIASGRRALSPAKRMILITANGRKTVLELRDIARGLGANSQVLIDLMDEGLLELVPGQADGPMTPSPPPVASPSTVPVPLPVTMAASPVAHSASAATTKRLASAKLYALDLLTLMLAGKDQGLRERARQVQCETSLMDWLDDCSEEIGSRTDTDRAALFRQRMETVLG